MESLESMRRPKKTALYVIIIICIIFFFFMGISRAIQFKNFMSTAIKTTATVTDFERHYRSKGISYDAITIKYAVDDKEYECYVQINPLTNLEVGEKIDIYYQEQNPDHPILESGTKLDIIFLFGYGIIGIIGLIIAKIQDSSL